LKLSGRNLTLNPIDGDVQQMLVPFLLEEPVQAGLRRIGNPLESPSAGCGFGAAW
jgi:hypothetical protein